MNLLIKNGTLIDPVLKKGRKASVLIEGGRIVKIKEGELQSDYETINADGKIVSPGFIDIHVHFRDPGYEHKEDIHSGLQAAAAGGYTSVCTMPNTDPVADNVDTVNYVTEKASSGNGVKLYPVSAATMGLKGKVLAPLEELKSAGVVAFSDDGRPLENTALLKRSMEYGSKLGLKYISHSEDLYLSEGAQMNDSVHATALGVTGVPVVGEASQIARDCMMAEYLDVPIHIAHVSTAMSVDIIQYFKERGVKVTAETAPHYLTLTDESVKNFNSDAKMNPPLRGEKDRLALIRGVKAGIIDCISTDHAPHHEKEKEVDLKYAPFGIIGLETAFPVVMKLFHGGILSIERIVELFTNGYSIMGIEGGAIAEGSLADLTIFDPDYEWTIDKKKFFSKSRNTPFHGLNVKGAVLYTVVNGKVVFRGNCDVCS